MPARCAARPNAELPYRSDPTFPNVSIPPGPAEEARAADSASARAEMGVRGGREDARDDTDALDVGRPCMRAGIDVVLGAGELVSGSCGVGTGGGGVGCPKGLFDANGLFELRYDMNRNQSAIGKNDSKSSEREKGSGRRAYPNAVLCGTSGDCWEACSCMAWYCAACSCSM